MSKTAEDYKKEYAQELSEISKDYYKRRKPPKLGRNEQKKDKLEEG